MARRYGCRPSALLGEGDPYRAYCLDAACELAGRLAEDQAIKKARQNGGDKPQQMRRFSGMPPLIVGTIERRENG